MRGFGREGDVKVSLSTRSGFQATPGLTTIAMILLLLRQDELAQLSAFEPALYFFTDKLPSGEGSEGTNGDSAGKRAGTSPASRARALEAVFLYEPHSLPRVFQPDRR